MSDEIAIVTGGAGFIGSRLVRRLLQEGQEVHVFDSTPPESALRLRDVIKSRQLIYKQVDLRDADAVRRNYCADATRLYHLASVVGVRHYIEDPLRLIETAIGGTATLLDLARKHETRVLFTSTSEVYGRNPKTPWSEDADRVLGPTSVDRWSYSTSKALCEHMLYAVHRANQLPMSIVRFFNVYGPGQAPIFVVSQSIYRALRGEAPYVYDDGRQTRCFTFVDDAIEGVIRAATRQSAVGEVINIGSDHEWTVGAAIEMILEEAGSDTGMMEFNTEKQYGRTYEDIQRRVPDVSKAAQLLNWSATTDLREGLRRTIAWSRERENSWWLS